MNGRKVMYENQIRSGMDFLDRLVPGWVDKVDTAYLDMSTWNSCVLGQLDIPYRHEIPFDDLIGLGFAISDDDYGRRVKSMSSSDLEEFSDETYTYLDLTAAWKAAIAARLA